MAETVIGAPGEAHGAPPHHEEPGFWGKYVFSTDHKMIAMQYLFTGMAMGLIGGFFAYAFRMQLAFPGLEVPGWGIVTPAEYNSLVTNHGSIMIFWVADYNLTPMGSTLWLTAVALEFVAFLLGGINFITTAMNARAPGMRLYDVPIVVWMIVLASILFMASVGPLIAGAVMLFMDQNIGTHFFDPAQGGDPILWQHLFWFFGHPEVYVVLLPALGIVAEIITVFARKKLFAYRTVLYIVAEIMCVFARKKLFAYRTVLYTAFGTGVLSFTVWAHHQFVAGIDPRMAHVFTITTLLISIPIAEMLFVYIATLYGGSIQFTTPMLWALAFIGEFLIGGVTGIFLGASGADIYFHDTYFVLAHFHYTFFPIAIIGTYAGITYWYPKMFGRMMDERLGKWHFWLTIIPFNLVFIPLFVLGAAGQHRRIYDFTNFPELAVPWMQDLRVLATVSLVFMLGAQVIFFWNLFWSLRRGRPAGENPWRANTLEWTTASPPPHGNWPAGMPRVYRGPYEYSVPDREEDYWPQNVPS